MQITVSVTTSYGHEWGGSETKSTTDSTSVTVKVQAHHTIAAVVTSNRYTMDVPYEASLTIVYADDSKGSLTNFRGVYHGVQINEINVVYEPSVPNN